MIWFQIFPDGPEFEIRANRKTFAPPELSLKDLHNAIPQHLFERSTLKSGLYISVHVFLTVLLHVCAELIPLTLDQLSKTCNHPKAIQNLVQPILWVLYWGWQGMFFAGIWCLGQSKTLVPRLSFWRKINQDTRPVARPSLPINRLLIYFLGRTWCSFFNALGQFLARAVTSYICSDSILLLASNPSVTPCRHKPGSQS